MRRTPLFASPLFLSLPKGTEPDAVTLEMALNLLALPREVGKHPEDGAPIERYPVSTSAWGAGERADSLCTPRGRHVVSEKIGAGLPSGAVLVGREFTGEIFDARMARDEPDRDWILSRILWLEGCEEGYNKGDNCDSFSRLIYIHGTPDDEPMGVPFSHGCVRMRNADVIEGDLLVTSGLGGTFPPGYPVGVIEEVTGSAGDVMEQTLDDLGLNPFGPGGLFEGMKETVTKAIFIILCICCLSILLKLLGVF